MQKFKPNTFCRQIREESNEHDIISDMAGSSHSSAVCNILHTAEQQNSSKQET